MLSTLIPLFLFISNTQASSYADGGDDIACWKAKVMVDCKSIFPGVELTVDWSPLYPTSGKNLTAGDKISIPSTLTLPSSLNVTSQLFSQKKTGFGVDHTNVHACLTKGGFCSPFVSKTPGLVTHSAALKGPINDPVSFGVTLEAGTWTFITHYRIYVDNNVRCDFAKGKVQLVLPKLVENVASASVVSVSVILSALGMAVSIFFLFASFKWRKTNVFKLASWKFCAIASFGALLGNASILLWIPPLSSLTCNLRPFLLPIAFDFLYFPLLLKTWRLRKILIDSSKKMKRNKLTDTVLFKTLAIPIVIDAVLALIWIIVSPMTTIVVPSLISETSFEHFCASDSSFIFQTIVLLIKVPWLFWGLSLAWQTRRIMSELNESSHIMLSMINMFFVLCYVCVIQFMITDSQSALVMLRALGTFVAATLTISIVLGPKVVQLLKPKKWGGGDIDGLRKALKKETTRRLSERRASEAETTSSQYAVAVDKTVTLETSESQIDSSVAAPGSAETEADKKISEIA